MSQVGKLYKFYFKKIWQKNWLRIIIFTLLIGVVWWFVIPWAAQKFVQKVAKSSIETRNRRRDQDQNQSREEREEIEKDYTFKNIYGFLLGQGKGEEFRKILREDLEKYEKELEEGDEKATNYSFLERVYINFAYNFDNGTFIFLPTPFSSDIAFFSQQTEEYNKIGEKSFWQMLFNIAWWNLSGVVILYWFIFEVFDKTFFPSRREGEEATVLTVTPGVKRSDVIWGKILAFLSFYFLINVALFLIPFSVYYFWLGEPSFAFFALLALITVVVGPLLFFGLIFAPYLFFSSLTNQRWIFSTLISFSPMLWFGIKSLSSSTWPRTLEKTFFNPLWFTIICLVCGVFFLTLYYLRYQEEDLN